MVPPWATVSRDEVVRLVDEGERLLQVDDVDAGTLGEDEALHLRVPTAGLVPEVHAAVEQLANGDDGHEPYSFVLSCRSGRRPGALVPGTAPPSAMSGTEWSRWPNGTRSHPGRPRCSRYSTIGTRPPQPRRAVARRTDRRRRRADVACADEHRTHDRFRLRSPFRTSPAHRASPRVRRCRRRWSSRSAPD